VEFVTRIISFLMCYLIASVSISVLYSSWRGQDVRTKDFPGASGMVRQYGWRIGLLIALADILKGLVAALPVWWLARDWVWLAPAVAGLGHCYPIWHGWSGGQGVATVTGAIYCIDGWLGLLTMAIGLPAMLLYRALGFKSVFKLSAVPGGTAFTCLVLLFLANARHGLWGMLGVALLMLVLAVRGLHVLRSGSPDIQNDFGA
jgi:acyl phosphate:glycerol-3-phosphate acyltransferase